MPIMKMGNLPRKLQSLTHDPLGVKVKSTTCEQWETPPIFTLMLQF